MSMKRFIRRLVIAILSSGWIIPLTASFTASYNFLFEVLFINKGHYPSSFHPVSYADEAFYFSMIWLFLVVFGWSFHLSGKPNKDEADN